MTRPRLLACAAAFAVLLTGCETDEERAARLAAEAARRHNAVVGAAIGLLAVLALRVLLAWVATQRAARRPPWLAVRRGPLARPLWVGAVTSEVLGAMTFGLVGAAVGWVVGPIPRYAGYTDIEGVLFVVFVGPFVLVAALGALMLVRLPKELPDVRTARFVVAALWHLVATWGGLRMVTEAHAFDGWHVFGAVYAAAGLAGATCFAYAVAVRVRQTREVRALSRL